MSVFAVFGVPPSMLDLGSGTGAMVKLARILGVDAVGVDKIARNDPDVKSDLATPLDLGRKFALVTCIEVAEHIPELYAGVFANSVCDHVERGGLLVFTAAGPGQAGDGHVHTKPGDYWRTMFDNRRMSYREDYTTKLRLAWHLIPMPQMWLSANLQVFDRRPDPEKETESGG